MGLTLLLPRRAFYLLSARTSLFNSTHQTPSWQWYYPYHFAPFAADFVEIEKFDIKFELGQPFKAFEQLMGVFPAARYVLPRLLIFTC